MLDFFRSRILDALRQRAVALWSLPNCSGRARGEPRSRSVEVRAIRGSSSTAPAPDQEGVLLCTRAKKGSLWPSRSEPFDTAQIRQRTNTVLLLTRRFQRAH